MPAIMNPYLSFRDQAAEALAFYQGIFGGEVETTSYGEGGMSQDPTEADKVMHGLLTSGAGFVLMASDTPASMGVPSGSAISLSLSGDEEPVLRGCADGRRHDRAAARDGAVGRPVRHVHRPVRDRLDGVDQRGAGRRLIRRLPPVTPSGRRAGR
jgi:PhnB protein